MSIVQATEACNVNIVTSNVRMIDEENNIPHKGAGNHLCPINDNCKDKMRRCSLGIFCPGCQTKEIVVSHRY